MCALPRGLGEEQQLMFILEYIEYLLRYRNKAVIGPHISLELQIFFRFLLSLMELHMYSKDLLKAKITGNLDYKDWVMFSLFFTFTFK